MSDVFESEGGVQDVSGDVAHPGQMVFDDDVLTKADFERLLEGNKVPPGQYVMKVSGVKRLVPGEKVGGDQVSFQVVMPPAGVAPPEGGWRPVQRLFKKFASPDEGQKKSESFDREDKARFIKACGVEIGPTVNMFEALQATVGSTLYVDAVNREKDGTKYQDLKGFKPYSG